MKNLKIKIITGFRKDQEISIDAEECHKAYHLFLNPDARTVFSNGYALRGQDIQAIKPDYNGTMGWNPAHIIDEYDMQEIRQKGIDEKLRDVMSDAKKLASIPESTNKPLSESKLLYLS